MPRHATYVAPYWEQANLETLAAIMTHGGKPKPELVDAFLELRELCTTYRTVLDGLTSGHASEAIDYWCGWSDKVTVQYREALLRLERE